MKISGIKPTGAMHLGNYLGAVARWAAEPQDDALYFVADLHAFTVDTDPMEVGGHTREMFMLLLAAGIDPAVAIPFVQSDVPAHTGLTYLLECTATFGEMQRMIQFKEKSAEHGSVRLSLLTYPALMAADILLYDAAEVPVGHDQSQHVELSRDLALRFNRRHGETFVVPRAVLPDATARIRDLRDPARKMAKSASDGRGIVYVLDPPEQIRAKIRRAVTDADGEVRYDPDHKPGVANLLEILAGATGGSPGTAGAGIATYAALKEAAADAVVAMLEPVQRRYRELAADPATVDTIRSEGADRAGRIAGATLARARAALGLLPSR